MMLGEASAAAACGFGVVARGRPVAGRLSADASAGRLDAATSSATEYLPSFRSILSGNRESTLTARLQDPAHLQNDPAQGIVSHRSLAGIGSVTLRNLFASSVVKANGIGKTGNEAFAPLRKSGGFRGRGKARNAPPGPGLRGGSRRRGRATVRRDGRVPLGRSSRPVGGGRDDGRMVGPGRRSSFEQPLVPLSSPRGRRRVPNDSRL